MSKQLTVKELIEKLKDMPEDALVITEGCDCIGEAVNIELIKNGHWADGDYLDQVLINR